MEYFSLCGTGSIHRKANHNPQVPCSNQGLATRTLQKAAYAAFCRLPSEPGGSALTRLEARIALADHEDLAPAADDLAVAVAGLGRLEGRQDFHGGSLRGGARDGRTKKRDCSGPRDPLQQ